MKDYNYFYEGEILNEKANGRGIEFDPSTGHKKFIGFFKDGYKINGFAKGFDSKGVEE